MGTSGTDLRTFQPPIVHGMRDEIKPSTVRIGEICKRRHISPPAHAVASRNLIDNMRGYMLYGDSSQPNPPAAIVSAVANGDIDVALVWGPLAGYFEKPAIAAILHSYHVPLAASTAPTPALVTGEPAQRSQMWRGAAEGYAFLHDGVMTP